MADKRRKNKESKSRKDPFSLLAGRTAFLLYLLGAGVLLTLYVHDGYFDIMEAKASCFSFVMACVSPFLLLSLVLQVKEKRVKPLSDLFDLAMLLFLFAAVVSTVFSMLPRASLLGSEAIASGVLVSLLIK